MSHAFILELKYCELCGTLWFRTSAADPDVYCPRCSAWIKTQLPGSARKENA